jgi:hypothetical protein
VEDQSCAHAKPWHFSCGTTTGGAGGSASAIRQECTSYDMAHTGHGRLTAIMAVMQVGD